MARSGRPKAELILTADEREQLTRDARRVSSAQSLALRSKMAARTGLSKTTIGKIWKDFGLKPHKIDHFKLSTDPAVHRQALRRGRPLPESA